MYTKAQTVIPTIAIVLVLLFSAIAPASVHADGETPTTPPPAATTDASGGSGTPGVGTQSNTTAGATDEPSQPSPTTDATNSTSSSQSSSTSDAANEATQPASTSSPATEVTDGTTKSAPATNTKDAATQPASTPAPTDEVTQPAPATELTDETPQPSPATTQPAQATADAASDDVASATPTPPSDELNQATDNTQVVVLNSDGQPEPLATQNAAEILKTGDPMWCPAGATPGSSGCTTSYTSFSGLVTAILTSGGSYSGNGVIYVAQSYNSSSDGTAVTLDSNLSSLGDLTVQGGWDFGSNTTVGQSTFNNTDLSITNWTGNLTLNNLVFDGAGLVVDNQGDVAVNNVDVSGNDGDGINITSTGSVNLDNVSSNGNQGDGAVVNNSGSSGKKNVKVNNSQFNGNGTGANGGDGLDIYSKGDVTISEVEASGNTGNPGSTGAGIYIGTDGNATLSEVDAFDNEDSGIIIDSYGNVALTTLMNAGYNGVDGVDIFTSGNVSINDLWAGLNDEDGLYSTAYGNSSLTNDAFFDNGDTGADVGSIGSVTVSDSFFGNCFLYNLWGSPYVCGNQGYGANLESVYGNIGVNNSDFSKNNEDGLAAVADSGSVTLNNVNAEDNGRFGAVAIAGNNVNICGGNYLNNGDNDLYIGATNTFNLSKQTQYSSGANIFPPASKNFSYNCFKSKAAIGNYHIVNVTGGEEIPLDCSNYIGTVLVLPDGDKITLPCPIRDTGELTSIGTGHLPRALPDGLSFTSGLEGLVLRKGQVVMKLNDGPMIVSFPLPGGGAASDYTILYWDGNKWMELPVQAGDLHDPSDGRAIKAGVHLENGYISTTVNFTGVFVLVKK